MPIIKFLPEDKAIEIENGHSLLEIATNAGIPLTHVCGGNARCSTCRVAVLDGLELLSERTESEQLMAERLNLTPCIRLACQARTKGDVKVRRLVLDQQDVVESKDQLHHRTAWAGEEMTLAILFADIRGFTPFAESLLPYDLIHVLNRYFKSIGQVIEKHGGYIDNYIGDGILAVFGCDRQPGTVLRGVTAGLRMLEAVEDLKPYLRDVYGKTFEIGIGIHYGNAVVGTIGWGESQRRTVIGDSVNFASRIESANKEALTRFLISEETYGEVRDHVIARPAITTPLKGKSGEYTLYEVTGLSSTGH